MGCVAESDATLRAIHINLTNIDKVAVIPITARRSQLDARARIRAFQGNMPFVCHLPCKRGILRTTVNLKRLVEFIVEHGQRDVARVVGFGLHCNQGMVEGLTVLGHVLIVELLVPQTDEALFALLLLAGDYRGI